MIKFIVKINEIEDRKTIHEVKKTKNLFFETETELTKF